MIWLGFSLGLQRGCAFLSPWKAAEGEHGAGQSLLDLTLHITSFLT